MGRNLKMPWSIKDTIENMEYIRSLMINQVRMVNLDGKGEEDVKEIHFDFNRVEEALKKQIPMRVGDIHVDEFTCPACGYEDITLDIKQVPKFCRNCGQALYQEN